MPYPQEQASRLGHVSAASNPDIAAAIAAWDIPLAAGDPGPVLTAQVPASDLPGPDRFPQIAISIDGSDMEIIARPDFPSVTVGWLQVAAAFMDLDQFWASRTRHGVDPRRLAAATPHFTISGALPGGMVRRPGMTTPDSWRAEVAALFTTTGFRDPTGALHSLTDSLFVLHGRPGRPAGRVHVRRCPSCRHHPAAPIPIPPTGTSCPVCAATIHPTDILRSVEEFHETTSNLSPMTRIMNSAERLLTIAIVDWLYRHHPDRLADIIIVQDGPLAFFGTTSPMKIPWIGYWSKLTGDLTSRGLASPLLVGLDKTGPFVDHAAAVARYLAPASVLPMTNDYIQTQVRGQDPSHLYGKQEFYGRRFLYKTSTHQMLTLTVPRHQGTPYETGNACADLAEYPSLRSVVTFLEQMQTHLYPNAVVPVALAHHAASLPRGTGQDVLTILTRARLGL